MARGLAPRTRIQPIQPEVVFCEIPDVPEVRLSADLHQTNNLPTTDKCKKQPYNIVCGGDQEMLLSTPLLHVAGPALRVPELGGLPTTGHARGVRALRCT